MKAMGAKLTCMTARMAAVHLNAGDLLHGKLVGYRVHRGGGAGEEIAVGDHVPDEHGEPRGDGAVLPVRGEMGFLP